MKVKLLFAGILCSAFTGLYAQSTHKTITKSGPLPIESRNVGLKSVGSLEKINNNTLEKASLCRDTLLYAEIKEVLLGTQTFYPFELWSGDGEWISHTFLNSGSVSISGAEIRARRNSSSGGNPLVEVSVYSVDVNNNPQTQLVSGTVVVGTLGYYSVIFSSPVTITGNYAMVVRPTTGVMDIVINDDELNSYDEQLAKYKSDYYASSSSNWIPVSDFSEYAGGSQIDFEPIVTPFVEYNINTTADVTPLTACLGEEVTFVNTTETGVVGSRMYNYQVFRQHFGLAASDSTFVWYLDNGGPLVWSGNTTHTYVSAGTYDTEIGTNGGFWSSCFDFNTYSVTINDTDDASFSYGVSTVCVGGSDITPSSIATAGGTFSSTGGLIIDPTTGEIDITNSPVGSYVITYAFGGTCPSSSTQNLEITNSPDATFSYAVDEFCSNGTNPSPTATTAGTFSSTAGLSINSSTGEINLAASTPATYTVTNEVSISGCPVVSGTFDITINAAPTVAASADNTEVCSGEEVTLTGSGADSYTWDNSVTDGVAFEPAVGTLTYTVTGTDANGCENTATVDVTVNALPNVSGGADQSVCDGDEVTLSGSGADSYVWDNGVMNGVAFTQATGTTETYTVTGTDANGCENIATVDVTVNTLPAVGAGTDQTVCEGTQVTLNGSGADVYAWDNGVTDGVAFTATATETYTVTGTDANGCENTATVEVTVNAAPSVSLDPLGLVCDNAGTTTLAGGTPAGGTYSGAGVSGGIFDPAVAGVGTHTITYTYEDGNGCEGSATASIEVDACAGIEAGNVETLSVFPNPASSELNIVFENVSGTDATVVLTTTDGKVVYQTSAKAMSLFNEKINVTDFANGIYFINIKSETTSLTQRVVLN